MKLKAIVAVCALAFAGQAFAVSPTPAQAAAYPVQLHLSGASALQTSLGQIAKGLFVDGTISTFTFGADHRAYAGTFKSGNANVAAALVGQNGVLFNSVNGGSVNGVVPVALASTTGGSGVVVKLDLTTCGVAPTATDLAGNTSWTCTGTVASVPDAGVSDVEPAMFVGINVKAGGVPSTPAIVNALTSKSSLAQPMGIIVNTAHTVTNLTKAEVAGLMNGTTMDWSWLDATVPAGDVIVCRRVAGSGTQAAINAAIFGFPCSSSQLTPATAQVAANPVIAGGKYIVIENASSGALAACMTAAEKGLDAGYTIDITSGAIALTPTPTANQITLPAGGRAIGLMGVDRPAKLAALKTAGITGTVGGTVAINEAYKFVSINGVQPTVNNVATGAYDIVVFNSFNRRTNAVGAVPALSGNQLAFFDALVKQSGDPAMLGSTKNPALPGLLAIADPVALNFNPALGADGLLLDPVMRTTKANSCQPLQQVQ